MNKLTIAHAIQRNKLCVHTIIKICSSKGFNIQSTIVEIFKAWHEYRKGHSYIKVHGVSLQTEIQNIYMYRARGSKLQTVGSYGRDTDTKYHNCLPVCLPTCQLSCPLA